ncbi:TSUP family transporter [Hymenobacter sp. HMF4947]|uniref:Probable membrane transporter protein n=1 Tax=Hymenobacter ginkgonis TaxID=2682976 RepID=A0A7K1TEX5_9BACT|nr:TSUP family transporter [Hymenobacter ginkgonis]MVN76966.1 TSUP family transporter [Hymenobacter ginkgonis]
MATDLLSTASPVVAAASSAGPSLPVFLDLEQRRVLLVGGGHEALAQLTAVLHEHPHAAVTVVAPQLLPALYALAAQHAQVILRLRAFEPDDLVGHDLVLVATDDAALHGRVRAASSARRLHAVAALGPADEAAAIDYWRRVATYTLGAFALFLVFNILSYYFTWQQVWHIASNSGTFYTFVGVGFVAQLIDGMLGMGYGVVSAISLMSLGLTPAAVSGSIHTAEMFASGASGYNHYRFGNVNKRLFKVLLLPGIAGSISGAFLLAHFGERYADYIKPFLAVYLLILGLRIISKAIRKQAQKRRKVKNAGWLAGAGGFLDSFGGGGWGPLVTSTLIANGRTPQYVIGTVSLVEFFVTFASALTFFSIRGISDWQIILGLIVGGVAAAPIAARLAGRIATRWMFLGVGLMIVVWSLWALRKVDFGAIWHYAAGLFA